MSWDEFAERYEEWSAPMTAGVPVEVAPAREADGQAPRGPGAARRHLRRRRQPERSGLTLEALYGGFEREPLEDSSEEYVFVATRS